MLFTGRLIIDISNCILKRKTNRSLFCVAEYAGDISATYYSNLEFNSFDSCCSFNIHFERVDAKRCKSLFACLLIKG